jgi:hypothetical protein
LATYWKESRSEVRAGQGLRREDCGYNEDIFNWSIQMATKPKEEEYQGCVCVCVCIHIYIYSGFEEFPDQWESIIVPVHKKGDKID